MVVIADRLRRAETAVAIPRPFCMPRLSNYGNPVYFAIDPNPS